MSSNFLVSLCVIRVEIVEDNSKKTTETMASRIRGNREPSQISVENFSGTEKVSPILPNTESQSTSRKNSQEGCSSQAEKPSTKYSDQISYVSGNPFVEMTKGILHLYKENELTDVESAASRSSTLCMLAIPTTMTCHDLMRFTAAYQPNIQCIRILRDASPNQYMALITFRSPTAATEFYESFNGTQYNFLEPDTCHLVFISRIEVADNGLPLPGHTELPLCPVCLERMDESVNGILTILCNHSFHANCLAKWGDTSCPVCRYGQTPELVGDSSCMKCGLKGNNEALWICLICGHVGCGRYYCGHAFQHYEETHHCYAMQLGNNRVWDYVGDNFVHRLLQDKDDGKLVQNPRSSTKSDPPPDEDKLDSMQLEFTYFLTTQLEVQRQYFEAKLMRCEQRYQTEIDVVRERVGTVCEENNSLKKEVDFLQKDKSCLEKRLVTTLTRIKDVQLQLTEERALRSALESNQTQWRTKCQKLEDENKSTKEKIVDLEEQVRDLMFYVEGQRKIEESENKEEIAQGSIVVGTTKSQKSRSKRGGKKH